MESRLKKIFSMGINIMSLAVWLGEDRKCSAVVVGLDLDQRAYKRTLASHGTLAKFLFTGHIFTLLCGKSEA